MRCLTLAEALRIRTTDIHFVCRQLQGELRDLIEDRGFRCSLLTTEDPALDQAVDARQTAALSKDVDWVIVDHYAIDYQWERAMNPMCRRMMVVDDLVDRSHECDILLDQTFGRHADDYGLLVSEDCTVLAGADFALLRPEFAAGRPSALARRKANKTVDRILVSLGGFDPDNRTLEVLETVAGAGYAADLSVTVVCGSQDPEGAKSLEPLTRYFRHLDIRQRVPNMAELMAASDIAIGAGGTTSWERCCMGLPALVCVLADNQREIARRLEAAGAIRIWRSRRELAAQLDEYVGSDSLHRSAVAAAARICDGRGLERVIAVMQSC